MTYIKMFFTTVCFVLLSNTFLFSQSFTYTDTGISYDMKDFGLEVDEEESSEEVIDEVLKAALSNENSDNSNNLLVQLEKNIHPHTYYRIYNYNDQLVFSGSIHNIFEITIDLAKLSTGKYYMNIENEEFFVNKVFEVIENEKA